MTRHLANQEWDCPKHERTLIAPDADAVLTDSQIEGFTVVPCPLCGGVLKPDVTFFGDNVNVPLVQDCYNRGKDEIYSTVLIFSTVSIYLTVSVLSIFLTVSIFSTVLIFLTILTILCVKYASQTRC